MQLPRLVVTVAGSLSVRLARLKTNCRSAFWKGILEKDGGTVGAHFQARRGMMFTIARRGDVRGRITIGNDVTFAEDVHVFVGINGHLTLGNGVFIGRGSTLVANENVRIGDGSQIAHGVTVIDSDHRFGDATQPLVEQGGISKPVAIGEQCWLGANVIVLKGVTIGDRSVIGAGSIVTNSIAEKSLAIGNPAQVRRAFNP